jgi:hypothetical protein
MHVLRIFIVTIIKAVIAQLVEPRLDVKQKCKSEWKYINLG